MEKDSGIILADSVTQNVQGFLLESLKQVKHSKIMLSAKKTKDINEIKRFLGNNTFYGSCKLDGLTLVVKFENGKFVQGITRGRDGIGEDVTEACRFIKNFPLQIPYKEYLELRGECVMTWDEFNRINNLIGDNKYAHPRGLAAGTLRQYDSNVIKNRELNYVVFECVSDIGNNDKLEIFNWLDSIGFETVFRCTGTPEYIKEKLSDINSLKYPVDGIIYEFTDRKYSESLGNTSHHENCRMALKWADEVYETTLRDIVWNTTKTKQVNPVAVFDPVYIDGEITRATLHNITYIKNLKLGIGDKIGIIKSNMIIPKVVENFTKSDTYIIPSVCPICGGKTGIKKDKDTEVLYCTNPSCSGTLLGKIKNYCSRDRLDIKGLSEATLEFLIDKGWVSSLIDLYYLKDYEKEWKKCEGFGATSVRNILDAIEQSRKTTLDRFIAGLNIPLIGRTQSKAIAKYFDYKDTSFFVALQDPTYNWTKLDGFGEEKCISLRTFGMNKELLKEAIDIADLLLFEKPEETKSTGKDLTGLSFVITGNVHIFKNRDEFKSKVESLGGKVASGVTNKVKALINNDVNSTSSKNKKAKELGVPIWTEEEFMKFLGE